MVNAHVGDFAEEIFSLHCILVTLSWWSYHFDNAHSKGDFFVYVNSQCR